MPLFAFALNRPSDRGRLQPCSHATGLCPGPYENPVWKPNFSSCLCSQHQVAHTSRRLQFSFHFSRTQLLFVICLQMGSSQVLPPRKSPSPRTLSRESPPPGATSPRFSWPHSYEARIPALWHWLPCPYPVELFESTVMPQNLSHWRSFKNISWMTG